MPRMRPRDILSSLTGLPRICPVARADGLFSRIEARCCRESSPNSKQPSRSSKPCAQQGIEAYLAGGCVRDLLLGREPEDYDVATSATPDIVLDMFPRTFAVGAHFGVVLVASRDRSGCCEDGSVEERCVTEVATFRSDGVYSDGRHPDEVRYTKTAAEDVQRRDFTINGLLLDPLRGGGALGRVPCRPEEPSRRRARLRWRPRRSRCRRYPRHRPTREALRRRPASPAARGSFCRAIRIRDRARNAGRDPQTRRAHSRREPRAHPRRADQDAHRRPCAPRISNCSTKPTSSSRCFLKSRG